MRAVELARGIEGGRCNMVDGARGSGGFVPISSAADDVAAEVDGGVGRGVSPSALLPPVPTGGTATPPSGVEAGPAAWCWLLTRCSKRES